MKISSILSLTILSMLSSNAKELIIKNKALSVSYDTEAQSFSLSKATGKAFVSQGRFAQKVSAASSTDSKIKLNFADGSSGTMELRGEQPFAFFSWEVRNDGKEELDLQKISPLNFGIELNKPAKDLRLMGTAGLGQGNNKYGSYLFLACADPETRNGVVSGWISEDRGSGVVFSEVAGAQVRLAPRIDYGHLRIKKGAKTALETLAIGYFDDTRIGLESYADLIKTQYDVKLPPRSATYCTWYSEKNGGAGDAASTVELAKFVSKNLERFGMGVIQIDDRWQSGPVIDGPARGFDVPNPKGPYKDGITPVAKELDKLGLTLGLWWLPFGANHADPAWKDRQSWFAKWANGQVMKTQAFGGTCLDLTNPEVRKYLAMVSSRMRGWGVKYYKMDGLWTGTDSQLNYINDGYKEDNFSNCAPLYDPYVSQIESYRSGLKLLRKSAGADVFFSGCCVSQNMRSFGGSIGLVDSMRIGPDYNHDGQGIKTGPLRASRLYFLNGKVWWNDPDPTKVRASNAAGGVDKANRGAVSTEIARLTTSFSAITGQFFLVSDWLPDLPQERLDILKCTMLSHDGIVRPVDYFDKGLPEIWLLHNAKGAPEHNVIGLFNWNSKAQAIGATLAKTGLDASKKYVAFDFWENKMLPIIENAYSYELPATSCKVIAVSELRDHPFLLSSSNHATQGIVGSQQENWDGATATLSGTFNVIAYAPCELRIYVPEGWEAVISNNNSAKMEANLLRLTVNFGETKPIKWSVSFKKIKK